MAANEDALKDSGGNALTMGMIGCLPDNVQQAIKSFSIRQGKQHVTFCFPFMVDILRRYRPDACTTNDLGLSLEVNQGPLTPALFFDFSLEVIEGYQSFVTLAPSPDQQSSVPVVLFTLYQRDTTEGLSRHLHSLVHMLLDHKALLSVWKLPVLVMDLSSPLLDVVVESCAQAILDIQRDNLTNTFQGKSSQEILELVKEKMVLPNVRTYQEHLQCQVKEVTSRLRSIEPESFLAIIEHLKSTNCCTMDYQKADLMMKSATTEPLISAFWQIWGQEQIACKVFPLGLQGGPPGSGSTAPGYLYPVKVIGSGMVGQDSSLGSLASMPMKEGLQSIIKCLKAQDASAGTCTSGSDRRDKVNCTCHICRTSSHVMGDVKFRPFPHDLGEASVFEAQSAFYRPRPSLSGRLQLAPTTTTPYSDALKAAAVLPVRTPGFLTTHLDSLSTLRNEFRRSYVSHLTAASSRALVHMPYYLPQYRLDTLGAVSMYPMVYRPRIITHNSHFYEPK